MKWQSASSQLHIPWQSWPKLGSRHGILQFLPVYPSGHPVINYNCKIIFTDKISQQWLILQLMQTRTNHPPSKDPHMESTCTSRKPLYLDINALDSFHEICSKQNSKYIFPFSCYSSHPFICLPLIYRYILLTTKAQKTYFLYLPFLCIFLQYE
jgi:hypothetical protein